MTNDPTPKLTSQNVQMLIEMFAINAQACERLTLHIDPQSRVKAIEVTYRDETQPASGNRLVGGHEVPTIHYPVVELLSEADERPATPERFEAQQ